MEQSNKRLPTEIGNTGLNIGVRYYFDPEYQVQVFPNSVKTVDKMLKNIAINNAYNTLNVLTGRVPLEFKPYNNTDYHRKIKDFVESCFYDMEHSLKDFIVSAMSFSAYGFSIHEKVYRYRTLKDGSKYNDNKVGIRKLPIRSQQSIVEFAYTEGDRELDYVIQQDLSKNPFKQSKEQIKIPRKRFMYFHLNQTFKNPEGESPLFGCYQTWKQLNRLLESELIATQKNLNSVPVLYMPSAYMDEDAESKMKRVYDVMKQGVVNISNGTQSGAVLPSDRDDDGSRMFELDLLQSSASNITAISEIIERKTNEIYQALFADVLQLGAQKVGGKDISQNKMTLLTMYAEARLKDILDVINNDLIPELLELNGYDKSKAPKLTHKSLVDVDLEEFSKSVQRLKATGCLVIDYHTVKAIHEKAGLPFFVPEDISQEELNRLLNPAEIQSRSGDSFNTETGGLNGTSDSVSEQDKSANNMEK